MIGDLTAPGQRLLVGRRAVSTAASATPATRARPTARARQSKPGTTGEVRALQLELKVLADVGLLACRTPASRR